MQSIIRSGTLNTNSPGPEGPRPHGRGSCREVGCQPAQLGELGAGSPPAPRDCLGGYRTENCSISRGGQATLSTFGIPGFAGRPRRHAGSASTARRALTTPATRLVTVPAAGLALAMPKCWQPAVTPAMRQAAAAADERERLGTWQDEEADFARHYAGAGSVEFTLAMEGN